MNDVRFRRDGGRPYSSSVFPVFDPVADLNDLEMMPSTVPAPFQVLRLISYTAGLQHMGVI